MSKYQRLAIGLLTCVSACTPGALSYQQLAPVKDPRTLTLDDLFRANDSTHKVPVPVGARLLAVVNTDSTIASLALYEYDDLFVLQIYVYNNASRPFSLNPTELVLMDGNRTTFRRLPAHEAANLYATRVRGIPTYEPKYTYVINATTQATLRTYGNTGTYNAQTQGTITPVADPYNALGYSIGAAIAASRNRKYESMASTVYQLGFGESSAAPAKTGGIGAVYWLKRRDAARPVILRFGASGYELRFAVR